MRASILFFSYMFEMGADFVVNIITLDKTNNCSVEFVIYFITFISKRIFKLEVNLLKFVLCIIVNL